MDSKIPIVRSFWGTKEYAKNEILPKPIFTNEYVFVWGLDNEKMLKEMGYNVYLMSEFQTDPQYSSIETQFYHKLETLIEAGKYFSEFIMLDWDSFLVRPLDDEFYKLLRAGGDVQVPLYAYPDEPGIGLIKKMTHPNMERYQTEISDDLAFFFKGIESQLRLHSWKANGMLISPNFNFCYTRNPNLGIELREIALEQNIKHCVEENAMFQWSMCSLGEYLNKHEPSVVQGTSDDTKTQMHGWDWEGDAVYKFNKYINQIKPKNLYFKHI